MIAALTLEQANAILDCVLHAGLYEPPKPTEPKEIIKSAAEVLKQAETAKRAGVTVPAVLSVIDIARSGILPDESLDFPHPIYDNEDNRPTTAMATRDGIKSEGKPPSYTTDVPLNDNDSRVDTAAVSTDAKLIERDQEQESTQIDLLALPRDFSKVSDVELRSLHATRHATLSKVTFELGLETSDYESAQANYDQAYKANQNNYEGNLTARREASFFDPEVVEWRDRVAAHHKKVIMLRSYKELIETEIKGLSREYTMRMGERSATP